MVLQTDNRLQLFTFSEIRVELRGFQGMRRVARPGTVWNVQAVQETSCYGDDQNVTGWRQEASILPHRGNRQP